MSVNILSMLSIMQALTTQQNNSQPKSILSPNTNNFDTSIFTKALDSNKDGKISADEFQIFLNKPLDVFQKMNPVNNNYSSVLQKANPVNNTQNTVTSQANSNIATASTAENPNNLPGSFILHPDWLTTTENVKLNDKKVGAYSKMVQDAIANETSSEKEIMFENPNGKGGWKTGCYFDENGVKTKEIEYYKDSITRIKYYEDGKAVKTLCGNSTLGKTIELLYDESSDKSTGSKSFDPDGKLTESSKSKYNDDGGIIYELRNKYDANEKLTATEEFNYIYDEAKKIECSSILKKSYDENGNVISTTIHDKDSDGNRRSTITENGKTTTKIIDDSCKVISETTTDAAQEPATETTAAAQEPAPEETFDI